jgi:hypothetical protein
VSAWLLVGMPIKEFNVEVYLRCEAFLEYEQYEVISAAPTGNNLSTPEVIY